MQFGRLTQPEPGRISTLLVFSQRLSRHFTLAQSLRFPLRQDRRGAGRRGVRISDPQQRDIAMLSFLPAAQRPRLHPWLAAAAGLLLGVAAAQPARAQETIKVGILHSLSGTMAISETTLKDVMLMLIDAQNKKGGLLGKKLEPVVVDPASNWPLFAEKARELISKDKVAVVFGCWTSVSRKSV